MNKTKVFQRLEKGCTLFLFMILLVCMALFGLQQGAEEIAVFTDNAYAAGPAAAQNGVSTTASKGSYEITIDNIRVGGAVRRDPFYIDLATDNDWVSNLISNITMDVTYSSLNTISRVSTGYLYYSNPTKAGFVTDPGTVDGTALPAGLVTDKISLKADNGESEVEAGHYEMNGINDSLGMYCTTCKKCLVASEINFHTTCVNGNTYTGGSTCGCGASITANNYCDHLLVTCKTCGSTIETTKSYADNGASYETFNQRGTVSDLNAIVSLSNSAHFKMWVESVSISGTDWKNNIVSNKVIYTKSGGVSDSGVLAGIYYISGITFGCSINIPFYSTMAVSRVTYLNKYIANLNNLDPTDNEIAGSAMEFGAIFSNKTYSSYSASDFANKLSFTFPASEKDYPLIMSSSITLGGDMDELLTEEMSVTYSKTDYKNYINLYADSDQEGSFSLSTSSRTYFTYNKGVIGDSFERVNLSQVKDDFDMLWFYDSECLGQIADNAQTGEPFTIMDAGDYYFTFRPKNRVDYKYAPLISVSDTGEATYGTELDFEKCLIYIEYAGGNGSFCQETCCEDISKAENQRKINVYTQKFTIEKMKMYVDIANKIGAKVASNSMEYSVSEELKLVEDPETDWDSKHTSYYFTMETFEGSGEEQTIKTTDPELVGETDTYNPEYKYYEKITYMDASSLFADSKVSETDWSTVLMGCAEDYAGYASILAAKGSTFFSFVGSSFPGQKPGKYSYINMTISISSEDFYKNYSVVLGTYANGTWTLFETATDPFDPSLDGGVSKYLGSEKTGNHETYQYRYYGNFSVYAKPIQLNVLETQYEGEEVTVQGFPLDYYYGDLFSYKEIDKQYFSLSNAGELMHDSVGNYDYYAFNDDWRIRIVNDVSQVQVGTKNTAYVVLRTYYEYKPDEMNPTPTADDSERDTYFMSMGEYEKDEGKILKTIVAPVYYKEYNNTLYASCNDSPEGVYYVAYSVVLVAASGETIKAKWGEGIAATWNPTEIYEEGEEPFSVEDDEITRLSAALMAFKMEKPVQITIKKVDLYFNITEVTLEKEYDGTDKVFAPSYREAVGGSTLLSGIDYVNVGDPESTEARKLSYSAYEELTFYEYKAKTNSYFPTTDTYFMADKKYYLIENAISERTPYIETCITIEGTPIQGAEGTFNNILEYDLNKYFSPIVSIKYENSSAGTPREIGLFKGLTDTWSGAGSEDESFFMCVIAGGSDDARNALASYDIKTDIYWNGVPTVIQGAIAPRVLSVSVLNDPDRVTDITSEDYTKGDYSRPYMTYTGVAIKVANYDDTDSNTETPLSLRDIYFRRYMNSTGADAIDSTHILEGLPTITGADILGSKAYYADFYYVYYMDEAFMKHELGYYFYADLLYDTYINNDTGIKESIHFIFMEIVDGFLSNENFDISGEEGFYDWVNPEGFVNFLYDDATETIKTFLVDSTSPDLITWVDKKSGKEINYYSEVNPEVNGEAVLYYMDINTEFTVTNYVISINNKKTGSVQYIGGSVDLGMQTVTMNGIEYDIYNGNLLLNSHVAGTIDTTKEEFVIGGVTYYYDGSKSATENVYYNKQEIAYQISRAVADPDWVVIDPIDNMNTGKYHIYNAKSHEDKIFLADPEKSYISFTEHKEYDQFYHYDEATGKATGMYANGNFNTPDEYGNYNLNVIRYSYKDAKGNWVTQTGDFDAKIKNFTFAGTYVVSITIPASKNYRAITGLTFEFTVHEAGLYIYTSVASRDYMPTYDEEKEIDFEDAEIIYLPTMEELEKYVGYLNTEDGTMYYRKSDIPFGIVTYSVYVYHKTNGSDDPADWTYDENKRCIFYIGLQYIDGDPAKGYEGFDPDNDVPVEIENTFASTHTDSETGKVEDKVGIYDALDVIKVEDPDTGEIVKKTPYKRNYSIILCLTEKDFCKLYVWRQELSLEIDPAQEKEYSGDVDSELEYVVRNEDGEIIDPEGVTLNKYVVGYYYIDENGESVLVVNDYSEELYEEGSSSMKQVQTPRKAVFSAEFGDETDNDAYYYFLDDDNKKVYIYVSLTSYLRNSVKKGEQLGDRKILFGGKTYCFGRDGLLYEYKGSFGEGTLTVGGVTYHYNTESGYFYVEGEKAGEITLVDSTEAGEIDNEKQIATIEGKDYYFFDTDSLYSLEGVLDTEVCAFKFSDTTYYYDKDGKLYLDSVHNTLKAGSISFDTQTLVFEGKTYYFHEKFGYVHDDGIYRPIGYIDEDNLSVYFAGVPYYYYQGETSFYSNQTGDKLQETLFCIINEYCSEQQEISISDAYTKVKFCDCNVFGTVLKALGEVTGITQHSDAVMSVSTFLGFDILAASFANFMNNFSYVEENTNQWVVDLGSDKYTSYLNFSNQASFMYENSMDSVSYNVIVDSLDSVIVGINKDYSVVFGEEESMTIQNLQTLVARLFGYNDVDTFIQYANNIIGAYIANAKHASQEVDKRLEYDGAIYTDNGSFVLPYVFKNGEDVVLSYVFVNSEGDMSVWLSDVTSACNAINFENETQETSTLEVYGRCKLFETPLLSSEAGSFLFNNEKYTISEGYIMKGGNQVGYIDELNQVIVFNYVRFYYGETEGMSNLFYDSEKILSVTDGSIDVGSRLVYYQGVRYMFRKSNAVRPDATLYLNAGSINLTEQSFICNYFIYYYDNEGNIYTDEERTSLLENCTIDVNRFVLTFNESTYYFFGREYDLLFEQGTIDMEEGTATIGDYNYTVAQGIISKTTGQFTIGSDTYTFDNRFVVKNNGGTEVGTFDMTNQKIIVSGQEYCYEGNDIYEYSGCIDFENQEFTAGITYRYNEYGHVWEKAEVALTKIDSETGLFTIQSVTYYTDANGVIYEQSGDIDFTNQTFTLGSTTYYFNDDGNIYSDAQKQNAVSGAVDRTNGTLTLSGNTYCFQSQRAYYYDMVEIGFMNTEAKNFEIDEVMYYYDENYVYSTEAKDVGDIIAGASVDTATRSVIINGITYRYIYNTLYYLASIHYLSENIVLNFNNFTLDEENHVVNNYNCIIDGKKIYLNVNEKAVSEQLLQNVFYFNGYRGSYLLKVQAAGMGLQASNYKESTQIIVSYTIQVMSVIVDVNKIYPEETFDGKIYGNATSLGEENDLKFDNFFISENDNPVKSSWGEVEILSYYYYSGKKFADIPGMTGFLFEDLKYGKVAGTGERIVREDWGNVRTYAEGDIIDAGWYILLMKATVADGTSPLPEFAEDMRGNIAFKGVDDLAFTVNNIYTSSDGELYFVVYLSRPRYDGYSFRLSAEGLSEEVSEANSEYKELLGLNGIYSKTYDGSEVDYNFTLSLDKMGTTSDKGEIVAISADVSYYHDFTDAQSYLMTSRSFEKTATPSGENVLISEQSSNYYTRNKNVFNVTKDTNIDGEKEYFVLVRYFTLATVKVGEETEFDKDEDNKLIPYYEKYTDVESGSAVFYKTTDETFQAGKQYYLLQEEYAPVARVGTSTTGEYYRDGHAISYYQGNASKSITEDTTFVAEKNYYLPTNNFRAVSVITGQSTTGQLTTRGNFYVLDGDKYRITSDVVFKSGTTYYVLESQYIAVSVADGESVSGKGVTLYENSTYNLATELYFDADTQYYALTDSIVEFIDTFTMNLLDSTIRDTDFNFAFYIRFTINPQSEQYDNNYATRSFVIAITINKMDLYVSLIMKTDEDTGEEYEASKTYGTKNADVEYKFMFKYIPANVDDNDPDVTKTVYTFPDVTGVDTIVMYGSINESITKDNLLAIDWSNLEGDEMQCAGLYTILPKIGDNTTEMSNYHFVYENSTIPFRITKAKVQSFTITPESVYNGDVQEPKMIRIGINGGNLDENSVGNPDWNGGDDRLSSALDEDGNLSYQVKCVGKVLSGLYFKRSGSSNIFGAGDIPLTGIAKSTISQSNFGAVSGDGIDGVELLPYGACDYGTYLFVCSFKETKNYLGVEDTYFLFNITKAELILRFCSDNPLPEGKGFEQVQGYAKKIYDKQVNNYPAFTVYYSGFVGSDDRAEFYNRRYVNYKDYIDLDNTAFSLINLMNPVYEFVKADGTPLGYLPINVKPSEGGEYYYIRLLVDESNKNDFCPNYYITVEYELDPIDESILYPQMEIKKRPVRVTYNEQTCEKVTKTYDGTREVPEGSVKTNNYAFSAIEGNLASGLIDGDVIALKIIYSTSSFARKDVYEAILDNNENIIGYEKTDMIVKVFAGNSLDGESKDNYELQWDLKDENEDGYVELRGYINQASATVYFYTDSTKSSYVKSKLSVVYNGEEQKVYNDVLGVPIVVGDEVFYDTVRFREKYYTEDVSGELKAPPKNCAQYIYELTILNETLEDMNYSPQTFRINLVITQAEVTISFRGDPSQTYGSVVGMQAVANGVGGNYWNLSGLIEYFSACHNVDASGKTVAVQYDSFHSEDKIDDISQAEVGVYYARVFYEETTNFKESYSYEEFTIVRREIDYSYSLSETYAYTGTTPKMTFYLTYSGQTFTPVLLFDTIVNGQKTPFNYTTNAEGEVIKVTEKYPSDVGKYQVRPHNGNLKNFIINNSVAVEFEITKADLVVKVTDRTMDTKTEYTPTFTLQSSVFTSDITDVATVESIIGTNHKVRYYDAVTLKEQSGVPDQSGSYIVKADDFELKNYNVTCRSGVLIINRHELEVGSSNKNGNSSSGEKIKIDGSFGPDTKISYTKVENNEYSPVTKAFDSFKGQSEEYKGYYLTDIYVFEISNYSYDQKDDGGFTIRFYLPQYAKNGKAKNMAYAEDEIYKVAIFYSDRVEVVDATLDDEGYLIFDTSNVDVQAISILSTVEQTTTKDNSLDWLMYLLIAFGILLVAGSVVLVVVKKG